MIYYVCTVPRYHNIRYIFIRLHRRQVPTTTIIIIIIRDLTAATIITMIMLQFLLIIIHVHHNIYTIDFIPKDSIRVIWSVIQCKMYKCTLYSACTYINLHPLYYIPIIYSYTLTHISAFWRTYINIIYIYIIITLQLVTY